MSNASSHSQPAGKAYRWIESQHWELTYHNLPRRVPWPVDAPPLDASSQELPITPLYTAIKACLEDESQTDKDPRFRAFLKAMDIGWEMDQAIQRRDFAGALARIAAAGQAGRLSPNLLFNKAFILRQTGDAEGAVTCYQEALEMAPDVEYVWMRLATTLEELGRREEAIQAYREALRCLPKHRDATEALVRLGVLVEVTKAKDPTWNRIMEADEYRQLITAEVERHFDNAAALRQTGGLALNDSICLDVALRALGRAVELDPSNVEGQRNYGEALRVSGKLEDAILVLRTAEQIDPADPWVHYQLGKACFQQGDLASAWTHWNTALAIDPNHRPTLEIVFLNRTDLSATDKECEITTWSAQTKSWCGYLLAAQSAWKRGDKPAALRYGSEAHKLAPDNEEVFLHYTGMLGEAGEPEWVAALTKPRLTSGTPTPRMVMNFARALNAMGLGAEAIHVLEDAVQNPALAEGHRPFQDQLDHWCGRVAVSEVPLELHPGGTLQRPILQTRDNQAVALLVPPGVPLLFRKTIQVQYKKDHFSLQLQQGVTKEDLTALNLGAFSVREINTGSGASPHVSLYLVLRKEGFVQAAAKQDDRKLPVTWSLYPPPAVEEQPKA